MGNALTKTEQKNLTRCEKVIETGLTTFFGVGQALWDIRDEQLYRGTHNTFEAYCNQRWDFSRQRAYQLIAATEVSAELSTVVDTPPERESHIRPLLSAPSEHRAELWQLAMDTAPRDDTGKPRMTAKHVADTVEAWQSNQREDEPVAASEPAGEPIDVESRPIDSDDATEDYDEPARDPVHCPTCQCPRVPDDEGDCPKCLEPLVAPSECSVENDSPETSEDDLFLSSIEEALRSQFDGRLDVAAARLENMVEMFRSEI